MGKRGTALIALIAPALGAFACSGFGEASTSAAMDDAGGGSDAGGDVALPPVGNAPLIHLSVSGPPKVLVGEGVQVTVSVTREGPDAFGGTVHVALAPIDGITAPAIDIPATSAIGTMTVTTAPTRRHGRTSLTFDGTSPGTSSAGSSDYTLLIRGAAGVVDTGFGVNGVFSLGQPSDGTGVLLDNGHILIGGRVGGDLAVVQLYEDGTPNMSYGTAGIFKTNVGTLQSTQDLIRGNAGGAFLGATIDTGSGPGAIVAAVTSAGALQVSGFGVNGVAQLPLAVGTALAASPLVGGVLVAGRQAAASPDIFATMIKTDGSVFDGWGAGGTFTQANDCPGADKSDCFTRALSVDSNGAFYACAFRHDGSIVGAGLVGGTASTTFPPIYTSLSIDHCASLAVDPAHRVYVGGDAMVAAAVSRYATNGALDDSWAANSFASAPAGSNLKLAKRLQVRADGTLLVASDAVVGSLGAFGLWRVLPDGTTDTSFAHPAGFVTKGINSTNVVVTAMAVDADDRVILVGGNGEMVATRVWQ